MHRLTFFTDPGAHTSKARVTMPFDQSCTCHAMISFSRKGCIGQVTATLVYFHCIHKVLRFNVSRKCFAGFRKQEHCWYGDATWRSLLSVRMVRGHTEDMILFWQMYQFGHPNNHLFYHAKRVLLGPKYTNQIVCNPKHKMSTYTGRVSVFAGILVGSSQKSGTLLCKKIF